MEAVVIKEFYPTKDGEIELKLGELIKLEYFGDDTEQWKGTIGNITGYFPSNCVEIKGGISTSQRGRGRGRGTTTVSHNNNNNRTDSSQTPRKISISNDDNFRATPPLPPIKNKMEHLDIESNHSERLMNRPRSVGYNTPKPDLPSIDPRKFTQQSLPTIPIPSFSSSSLPSPSCDENIMRGSSRGRGRGRGGLTGSYSPSSSPSSPSILLDCNPPVVPKLTIKKPTPPLPRILSPTHKDTSPLSLSSPPSSPSSISKPLPPLPPPPPVPPRLTKSVNHQITKKELRMSYKSIKELNQAFPLENEIILERKLSIHKPINPYSADNNNNNENENDDNNNNESKPASEAPNYSLKLNQRLPSMTEVARELPFIEPDFINPNNEAFSSSDSLICISPRESDDSKSILDPLEKQRFLRKKCIEELYQTEKDYIADLETLINVFIFPLKTMQIVPETMLYNIFSNVEVLINCNIEMLKSLESKMKVGEDEEVLIGDCFTVLADYFKMYKVYCANQQNSLTTADNLVKKNAQFKRNLDICHSDERCKGLFLQSFLIKPIQRVCKYPLLLRELIKYTPETHPDYEALQSAFSKINIVVTNINEGQRQAESLQRILDLQNQIDGVETLVEPGRRMCKEGDLMFYRSTSSQRGEKRHVFFFSDLIVLTVRKGEKRFEHKLSVPLESCKFIVLADSDYIKNAFELCQSQLKGKCILSCESYEELNQWTREFKSLMKSYIRRKFQMKDKNLHGSYDALSSSSLSKSPN